MWVLPSRGRPHNIRRLISLWQETGADSPVCLILDNDDQSVGGYMDLHFPNHWIIQIGNRRKLSCIYNTFFRHHPDLPWYGFIADDVIPETPNWDKRLIEAATPDRLAAPQLGGLIANHFVLGGDLVRSVGFLCLHGLDRIYIDTVWNDIARQRGVYTQTDIVLRHAHFSNGGALHDKTYRKRNKALDKEIYTEWATAHLQP